MNLDKRYLVVLADRKKGKFFIIFMGSFEDQGEEIETEEVPQKVKAEHSRPSKVQQHIHEHLQHHLKYIGQRALDFLIKRKNNVDGVIIGGHKELLSRIRENLPDKLKDQVITEFVASLRLPVGDLTIKANDSIKDIKPERQKPGTDQPLNNWQIR